tara:strand:+ start:534 stop:1343 length:810 start_codon:yes stop_codon:yes gene_type:complete
MNKEITFDILDFFRELKKNKIIILIFTVIYFFSIYFLNDYLTSFTKKTKYIDIEIKVSSYLDLPIHYMNLDNILLLNDDLKINKSGYMDEYMSNNMHLTDFINQFYFNNNQSSKMKVFVENTQINFISDTRINLIINDNSYIRNTNESDYFKFINNINLSIYNKIDETITKINESLFNLEQTLIGLNILLDHNTKSLNEQNKQLLNEYRDNKFDEIFKISHIRLNEKIDDPFNLFNKFKMNLFFVVTYFVFILLILIFSYSVSLKKLKR